MVGCIVMVWTEAGYIFLLSHYNNNIEYMINNIWKLDKLYLQFGIFDKHFYRLVARSLSVLSVFGCLSHWRSLACACHSIHMFYMLEFLLRAVF